MNADLNSDIEKRIRALPRAAEVLDRLSSGLDVAIFGGSIRDIVSAGTPGNDLDVIVYGADAKSFQQAVGRIAESIPARLLDYPDSHIVFIPEGAALHLDLHYPKATLLEGLVRSDFTVNGIGFKWKERTVEDPLEGIQHLRERRLVIHSPQYVVTNPPNFPRMFRTAAKLGFPIEGDTERVLRRFAPMISMNEGRTNVRTMYEFLKFLSMPTIAAYLRQMRTLGVVEALIPELNIPGAVAVGQDGGILDRNVAFAGALDGARYGGDLEAFMTSDLGLGITNLGVIRLLTLFLDFGPAFAAFKPDAPYIRAVAPDIQAFVRRIEANLCAFIAARYNEAPDLAAIFRELPSVLAYLRAAQADPPQEKPELSRVMKNRAEFLLAAAKSMSEMIAGRTKAGSD